ncbi:MAG TPA: hypothetical protein VMV41_13570 [Cellulomonadaceae bacterium]|nr:hypothetical protein [Cellulomonadaceae bacterium]
MNPGTPSVFDLPDHLAAKDDPTLIAGDERHFTAIARCLEKSVADLSARLDAERKAPAGTGRRALDRDLEIHRLTARLRTLRRFGLDLCLGRMVGVVDSAPVHVGRLGLQDDDGRQLLIDWRSPAAEPFFGATHAQPMGLTSRRRYRWSRGRIVDFWDEVFAPDGLVGSAALDDPSAFIVSLGTSRSPRMRDVLATIQADQDAIIRAGSRGALVVDGGPGTGKTVVALHRTAYLLYSDPRLGHRRGGVLFVGPHQPYLAYVSDVLPSLGEEGVQTCTLRDLVPEGATAAVETDPEVRRLKADARMVAAIEPAVAFYERPPTAPLDVVTPCADVRLDAADWAEAFSAPDPGTPHHEARDQAWEALLRILVEKVADDLDDDLDGPDPADEATGPEDTTPRTPTTRSTRTGCPSRTRMRGIDGRSPRTATSRARSDARGRCWRRPTSSPTCGPCPPTYACARHGSPLRRSGRCSARSRPPGPSRTCRSWTPHANGSATRRHRTADDVRRRPQPPSASAGPTSSTTSSRPTTPSCTSCRCCAARTCGTPSPTRSRRPAPARTCWSDRSRTSSWTRPRS